MKYLKVKRKKKRKKKRIIYISASLLSRKTSFWPQFTTSSKFAELTMADDRKKSSSTDTLLSPPSLSFPSPCWSRSSCLSYLVEFLTRLNNFSKTGLFIVPGRGMSPCGEEGRGGGGVRVVCLRGGGPHPPAVSLSGGTGLRVQWSPARRRSLSARTHTHTHTHTHTQSQSLYTVHSSVLQMSYQSS